MAVLGAAAEAGAAFKKPIRTSVETTITESTNQERTLRWNFVIESLAQFMMDPLEFHPRAADAGASTGLGIGTSLCSIDL